MLKRIRLPYPVLLGVLLLAALIVAACGGNTAVPVTPAAAPAVTEVSTEVSTEVATEAASPAAATEAATGVAAPAGATEAAAGAANVRVFTIDQGQSEARFRINEELMGAPTSVVGVTSLVDGSITVDLDDMSKTALSTIQIDARDFRTDEDMRNRALRRFILQSADDKFQYITFAPTRIEGLPTQAKAGDTLDFKVTGDLTIRDISKPVTFAVTVKVDDADQLSGQVSTTITRADYDLQIPTVPSVANVGEEVVLELTFVAKAS